VALMLLVCALLGAWLTTIVHQSIGPLLAGLHNFTVAVIALVLSLGGPLFSAAFRAWLLGLAMLGVPAWWLLHQSGLRDWPYFSAVGAALAGVGYVTVFDDTLPVRTLPYVAEMLIVGGVVGKVFWHLAYPSRRSTRR
jgi:hypothetical protein